MVRLLPGRGVVGALRLPEPLHVADGLAVAAAQAPPNHLEGAPPPLLRRRMVATQPSPGAVRPGEGEHTRYRYRYRYRGTVIPSPWPATSEDNQHVAMTGLVESPVP